MNTLEIFKTLDEAISYVGHNETNDIDAGSLVTLLTLKSICKMKNGTIIIVDELGLLN